jgi:hypothetical protein
MGEVHVRVRLSNAMDVEWRRKGWSKRIGFGHLLNWPEIEGRTPELFPAGDGFARKLICVAPPGLFLFGIATQG